MNTDKLLKLLGPAHVNDAKLGPFTIMIGRGQNRGAKVCTWLVQYQRTRDEFGKFITRHYTHARCASESEAHTLCEALNEAYVLWCVVRDTKAEKEYFP